ncbi:hypothetical protein ABZ922_31520 [Streptomyces shenzhenensis]|uniref:hypothetical protein n=1 Tax=Streptomyces shenzhenensis TaxID=943815 RepID=UPI0033E85817
MDDFAAHVPHLHTVLPAEASHEVAQSAVRLLYRNRTVLTGDRLSADPRDCEHWGNGTRRTHAENTTLRIPEQVMGPLLTWCLRIVDDPPSAATIRNSAPSCSGRPPCRPQRGMCTCTAA